MTKGTLFIKPTPEQINTYEAMFKAQLCCRAETELLKRFKLDISSDLKCPEFKDIMGYEMSEALNPRSKSYLLEKIADKFEEISSDEVPAVISWELAVEAIVPVK